MHDFQVKKKNLYIRSIDGERQRRRNVIDKWKVFFRLTEHFRYSYFVFNSKELIAQTLPLSRNQ